MSQSGMNHYRSRSRRAAVAALLATTSMALCSPVLAQSDQGDEEILEEIVIQGFRATVQNSIAVKRESLEIVDALSADDIGDLPALSIGEALETLTGAASHREQGGATEIAIRGLGPFLSSTVINGRAATNGSGDRSVNFSQFPSELFNKIAIYKTQSASQIEGGVAGQIALETIKPLDYGKRRIQGEFKLNYNPDNQDIADNQRLEGIGYRGTLSYVDQFDVGDGKLGISLGYQRNDTSNPEQEANVSNTLNYCKNDPTDTGDGVFDDGNCNSSRPDEAGTEDFVIARNSYTLRQNATSDTRDAVFGAIQFQPTADLDINLDFQYAKRLYVENRHDLIFSEGRRVDGATDGNRLDFPLIIGPNGELQQFTGETRVETVSEYVERDEEYYGGGLAVDYQVSDRLRVSADISYSQTQRFEEQTQVRLRTNNATDIFGNTDQFPDAVESDGSTSDDRIETAYLIRQNGSEALNFFVQDFDVNNHDIYSGNPRVRYDLDQDRYNSIFATRGDFEYELDQGIIKSILGGVRYQDLTYRSVPGGTGPARITADDYGSEAVAAASQACRLEFPESGFLSSVSGGNPLVTNLDSEGNVIGTTNTYATFDALCLAQTLEANDPDAAGITFDSDGVPIYPTGDFDAIGNSDVSEITWAGYVQANFETELADLPLRGNFGLRVINTKVNSTGFRGSLTAVFDDDTGELVEIDEDTDSLVAVTGGGSYTKFLPSFNVAADITPDLQGRFAVFRALSRPDPSALSFGRSFQALVEGDNVVTDIADAFGTANATGNPFTDPLMSWNVDLALEWYPNKDTILAGGVYYKRFNGGFEAVGQLETFTVDGQDLETLVTTVDTVDDTSNIYGFELTAAHRLSYLPAPFDGLGFKVSYNYADSDFEFQDDTLGAISTVNSDGTISTTEALVPPAEIFGLSKHVLAAQAYYEIGDFAFQLVYKYRSQYFQQFINTPGRVRYVDNVGVYEGRISYNITDTVRASIEAINIFNEPRVNNRGTVDDFGAIQVYGPRIFAGIRAKF